MASWSHRLLLTPVFLSVALRPPPAHSPTILEACDREKTLFQEWEYDDAGGLGYFRLEGTGLCLDNAEPFGEEGSLIQVYPCHVIQPGKENQSWDWDPSKGVIRSRVTGSQHLCIERRRPDSNRLVLTSKCQRQAWTLSPTTRQLVYNHSKLCLSGVPANDPIQVPRLRIDPKGVLTTGCSNGADFAAQFHVAFSSLVSGTCVFSGQPYRCATTRFPNDYLLPQTNESSVPNCVGCPEGQTLIYDHCKNKPWWVVPEMLSDVAVTYAKAQEIEDVSNLKDDNIFLFRGSHDKCYLDGSMENVRQFYTNLTVPEDQIKLVNNLPFPHTLPLNSTPYSGHTEPAGYDGPGKCMDWVFFQGKREWPTEFNWSNVYEFDQMPYIDDYNAGLQDTGFLYIPKGCSVNGSVPLCRLIIYFQACGCGGVANDIIQGFGPWAESNNVVVISPCTRKGSNNSSRTHPGSSEIARGCLDAYGQLGADYATSDGIHMRIFRKILRQLTGF
ncbi:hypothetical protein AAMO2058_000092300 [Amorphochlora amoebiformis]